MFADWMLHDLVIGGMVLGFAFVVLGAVVLYFEADARRAMEEREKRNDTLRRAMQDWEKRRSEVRK